MNDQTQNNPTPRPVPVSREPISPTCEVVRKKVKGNWTFCDLPTAKAYPAQGGGWQALCYKHGLKHDEAFTTDELIRAGNKWA